MPALTARELQVLRLICDGESSKHIAARLKVSEQAVKAHVTRLFAKFAVANRAGLVAASGLRERGQLQARNDSLTARNAGLVRENTRLRGVGRSASGDRERSDAALVELSRQNSQLTQRGLGIERDNRELRLDNRRLRDRTPMTRGR